MSDNTKNRKKVSFREKFDEDDIGRLLESISNNQERLSGAINWKDVAIDLGKNQKRFEKYAKGDHVDKLQRGYKAVKKKFTLKENKYVEDNIP